MNPVTQFLGLLFFLLALVSPESLASDTEIAFSDFYLTLAFRESPFAPHKGIHRISSSQAQSVNHYRFDYDSNGRLSRISFRLGDALRRPNHTANYFWHASVEEYRYSANRLTISYRDEWNQPTTVMGDVGQSAYTLDEQGRRIDLRYMDLDGQPVNNAWNIHYYAWAPQADGSVIEQRFDTQGTPISLRPGFEFGRVRIGYDASGFTRLLQFVDDDGALAATAEGFSQDRFSYAPSGELVRYEVLGADGNPANNHQGVSGGTTRYTPAGYEHVARYFGADGQPVPNGHGWWQSFREYDRFGNLVTNAFQDKSGKPRNNPNTGYATARIDWHEDGLRRRSFRYFDADGQPTNHASRGYHEVRYQYDANGAPRETLLLDTGGHLVDHAGEGWAVKRFQVENPGKPPRETSLSLAQLRAQRLNDALKLLHSASHVPGMAAAIAVNGKIVWQGQAGLANTENNTPVNAQTVFRLASVSKAVTSMVAATQLEAGTLNLSATPAQTVGIDHPATLAQLLAHTGSVSHYGSTVDTSLDVPYASSMDALGTVPPHLLEVLPGTEYLYSTFGYTLAGAMIESAANESLPNLLAKLSGKYATPSLQAPLSEAAVDNLATFYELSGDQASPARPRNFSYSFAGAGMVSSAGDLARFASLFASAQIVSAIQRDTMFQPASYADGFTVTDSRYQVGLGWRQQAAPDGATWHHHAGVTDGARSVVAVEPELGMAVVLLSNASWSSDMFATAMTLSALYLHQPSGPGGLPAAVTYQDTTYPLESTTCRGITCSQHNADAGTLNQWLNRDGRGAQFRVASSAGANYLVSPYGLAWFHGHSAQVGSRLIRLDEPNS